MATMFSVNVNKIATLRNARGSDMPNVLKTALDIERFGAQGITVHPRPDERHIKKTDVYDIAKHVSVEFNIEGYPSREFIDLVRDVRPAQATLVPDPPDVITSNAGWKVKENTVFLKTVITELKTSGARVSIFVDPKDFLDSDFSKVVATGADRVELYTEAYAKAYHTDKRDEVLKMYRDAAYKAHEAGLGINAGHDLNLDNLNYFIKEIPIIDEVSIGHAVVCAALYLGLEQTVKRYLECLKID